ncbi:MAG: phosphoglycerate dehydrogenase-like oxidoreductase [Frankiales bacterium]|nr:phosphoglycerate dehydrogenase-like oxidoreductase [Frankiales bacterium]
MVVLDDYQDVARTFGPWGSLTHPVDVRFSTTHIEDPALLVELLQSAEIVVAMRERTAFGADILAQLPNLKLLITTAMGNAAIDMAAAARLGITVCGTGYVAAPTAELTWALILAVARQVPREDAAVRNGAWQQTVGIDLEGNTLGVMGLGNLGSRVARIGQAFGMRVIAWSQNLDPARAESMDVTPVSKEELLAASDVLTLHLRLSERTRGIVGATELARMKPSVILINTSRGPLIDEPALLAALTDGAILGAGLDVYDQEPLPLRHPLRTAPRTVLTPHLGYVTETEYRRFYTDIVQDIQAYLDGSPVRVVTV